MAFAFPFRMLVLLTKRLDEPSPPCGSQFALKKRKGWAVLNMGRCSDPWACRGEQGTPPSEQQGAHA